MLNLLLTGCAGFIGINFLEELKGSRHLNKYSKIISIDKMGYATVFNRERYYQLCTELDIHIIDGNIVDIQDNIRYRNTIDGRWDILDFASESHVDNSIQSPSKIFNENTHIPPNIVDFITKNDIRNIELIHSYIHITTDETLGQLELHAPEPEWFTETSEMKPQNPYSASKAAQDLYLRSLQHTFGLNLKFIRLSNQFGPYQHIEKMLPATVLRSARGEPIKIYGKGQQIRQWCPVVDSVKIIADVLFDEIDPKAFNNDIIQLATRDFLADNTGMVFQWQFILKTNHNIDSSVEYVEDRKGHDSMYALKTNDIVASYYKTSLFKRFEETIAHYLQAQKHYTR